MISSRRSTATRGGSTSGASAPAIWWRSTRRTGRRASSSATRRLLGRHHGRAKGSVRDVTAWAVSVRGPHRPERRQLADGKLAYLTQVLVDQTLLGGGT